MFKFLTSLMLINFSCSLLASWQENKFDLNASYRATSVEQKDLYKQRTNLHYLDFSINKVTLLEGMGLRMSANASPFVIRQDEINEDNGSDYSILAESALFLSANSEFAFGLSNTKNTEFFDNRLNSLLLGIEQELTTTTNSASANLTLGKDKSFFYLNFLYKANEKEKESFTTGQLVEEVDSNAAAVQLLWRQSESTLWGLKAEALDVERSLNGLGRDFDIKNYYLSSVTEYLGSSQLSVNLGSSKVHNKQHFSWDVTHKTHVSEHTNFNLRSYRKFEQAIDNSQNEELTTHHEVGFSYQPIDYITTRLNYYSEQRERNEMDTYKRNALTAELAINYKTAWTITTGYTSENVTDEVSQRELSQNRVQLTISRAFI